MGIWWSTILGLVLSAWAVRSPLHSADSNFGSILTTDESSREVTLRRLWGALRALRAKQASEAGLEDADDEDTRAEQEGEYCVCLVVRGSNRGRAVGLPHAQPATA